MKNCNAWSEHISKITNKANGTLSFLHRNLKNCPSHIKSSCYKSLVVPILECGCTVWDPHLQKDINKIEKIWRRAATFVKNDYSWNTSVTDLINNLQWQNHQSRKTDFKVLRMYKIIHNLVSIPSHHLVPNTSHTRHHNFTYQLPQSKLIATCTFFSLSNQTLEQFGSRIKW